MKIGSSFANVYRRLLFFIRRDSFHREMEQEMRLHVELRARKNAERGVLPEIAQSAATRRFGNQTALQEQAREAWVPPRLDGLVQDVRYAWRGLRRNPAFSLTAILVIAVGIGSSTAVFSVVDRLLFRGLPYPEADRLVSVGITAPILAGSEFLIANDYLQLREAAIPFADLGSMTGVTDCDLTEDHPLRLNCAQVDSAFLATFGIKPYLGRNFTHEEDRPGVPKVALVSYGFWHSRLGGDFKAVGTIIPIDGMPTRIIGVLPQTFEMPNLVRADLLVPQAVALTQYRPGQTGRPVRVFGRLKPGITIPQAFSQLQPYFRQEMNIVPPAFQKSVHPVLRSLRDYQVNNVRTAAWLLLGGTMTILFIVCANVASLLLARSMVRAQELAVRSALGAGVWRLRRQVFTESGLLSLAGGASGCVLASALLQVFKALAPTSIPRLQQATLDRPILFFAVGVTLACGVVFGVAPAVQRPRSSTLANRTPVGTPLTSRRLLITAQLALSLVLLSVSSLLLESLWKMENVATGISTTHVLTADITLSQHRYPNAVSRQHFFEELVDRLRGLPDVMAVALTDTAPPSGFVHNRAISMLQVRGQQPLPLGTGGLVDYRSVTPEYFKALGIPILRGSGFQEKDRASKVPEYILSDSLARRLFGSKNPVGQNIHYGRPNTEGPVVGVAADVKNNGLSGKSDPEYYVLRRLIDDPDVGRDEGLTSRSLQTYDGHAVVIVRTAGGRPEAAVNWIRSEMATLDPTTPVTISTLSAQVRALTERPRFNAVLLSAFALTGLLLAAAGLYGLLSYVVIQRRQEIGVRMAVGATPRQIGSLILTHALRSTVAGIGIGVAGTWIASRFLGNLLFEVSPYNPLTFGVSATVLLLVAIAAALIPALRASRIDPMVVLRQE